MSNTLKNTDLVTKFALPEFLNSLQLASKVDRQLDQKNVYAGKVGDTVRIRKSVYFEATDGAPITAGQTSNIEEGTVSVQLDKRKKVVFSITSQELTLNIEEANERYIKPAMLELAQQVESDIADVYKYFFNFVGTPTTSPSTFLDVANAAAKLDLIGVPDDMTRCAFYGPSESVTLADALKGVFPSDIAKKAIERAKIGMYGNFDIFKNQSLKIHTVGAYSGTPLVDGASQNVAYAAVSDTDQQTLNTKGWGASITDLLKAGDVITLAGVNSVNRRTREDTGQLAQFAVIADADSDGAGDSALTISPPMIVSGPYQTVTAAPADNAAISIITGAASSTHRQNIAFHKSAITLAVAKLDLPQDGATASRGELENVSIRTVRQYNDTTDETRMRFDILYAVKAQIPGFGVRTTS